jgi:hypothetical protein
VREFPHARKGTLPEGDVPVRGIVSELTGEAYQWARLRQALVAEFEPAAEATERDRPVATKLINAHEMWRAP